MLVVTRDVSLIRCHGCINGMTLRSLGKQAAAGRRTPVTSVVPAHVTSLGDVWVPADRNILNGGPETEIKLDSDTGSLTMTSRPCYIKQFVRIT